MNHHVKTMSHCRRTLRGKDHNAAGWGIDRSVELQAADAKSICSATNCAVLPAANAGQYTTLLL